jgi:chaperonin cofactor prefoldin
VETRINRYENNHKMLENVYSNMTSRLARLVARLNTLGADTSKLTTDIATLQTMIDKMKQDQADFIASLSATQSTQTTEVCGQKDAEFVGKIGEARKVSALVKADRKAIRDFFQTTIRTDLKEIRAKLATEKEPTKEEEAEAEKTNSPIIPTTPDTTTTTNIEN